MTVTNNCPLLLTALPIETAAGLVRRKVVVKNKTLAATVTLGEKFARHDVNSAGIAVAGEEFVPRANSMKGNVDAAWDSLVEEFIRVADGGKNSTIADGR